MHINRALREAGLLRVRDELGLEKLDAGASEAFAVADHQVAHVYVRRPERVAEVQGLLEALDGVERVLDDAGKRAHGLDHPRSGELVAIAARDRWFTLLLLARRRPRARLRAHRRHPPQARLRPGRAVRRSRAPAARRLRVGWRLAQKALGFRYLMDVIPLDASLVKGSHGRLTDDLAAGRVIISSEPELLPDGPVDATAVKALLLDHVFGR